MASVELSTRLLNTVYWSLGTLATVTALLIGFGWFANFRVYERDKGAMRTELLTEIGAERSRISDDLRTKHDQLAVDLTEGLGLTPADEY
jgi:hypothetical protein